MADERLYLLCVDDERVVLDSLRDQLRRHLGNSVTIEAAESGEEGLELIDDLTEEGDAVAVVISDQLMPEMRGEDFLARVHGRDPRVINVLLTGQATADAVGEAVNRAKLYRYIAKPWNEDDLMLTVRRALDAYRQARALERQDAELRRAHAASLRFVPYEFLRLLGRERLADVVFGDHVRREMHVLFSDMRAYTRMVEGKTATEAFGFVNEYMRRLDAVLRDFGGFIGNIEGDAILALFPGSADDAVRAGVACHQELRTWNAARANAGEEAVRMGVGVNSGPLLLGTVGGEHRIQCDVVGSPVNLASRIESLTKLYDTSMLVSEQTMSAVESRPEVRIMDRVVAKGSELPITLFEVLDALEPNRRKNRLATRTQFEAATEAYRQGELEAAKAGFEEVLVRDPNDGAALLYRGRVEELAARASLEGWDGVTRLARK